MSDEEDTTILLTNDLKMNCNFKEMTIIIPIIEKHNLSPKKKKQLQQQQHLLSSSCHDRPHSVDVECCCCGCIEDDSDQILDSDAATTTDDNYRLLQITTVIVFLAGFIYGYDMPNILSYLSDYANTFELTCIQQSLLMVAWAVGGCMALIIGTITSLHCRYTIILYSVLIILIGTTLQMIVPGVKSMWWLLYGSRALIGFGCVLSASAHTCYICELLTNMATMVTGRRHHHHKHDLNKERGYRIGFHQFGVTCGVFISLCSAYFFKSNSDYGWRTATALNIIPILLHLLLTIIFIPKLSSSTTNNNHTNDNKQDEEINNNNNNNNNKTIYITFLSLFLITFGIHLSGRQSILSLAPTIFIQLGIDPIHAQTSVSTTISIVRVICCLISINIIDKLGRKSLLLMSQLIMFISLLILFIIINNNIFGLIKFNIIKYGDYCPYFRVIDSTGLFTFGGREQQMQLIGNNMIEQFNINNQQDNNNMIQDQEQSPLLYPMLPTPLSLISSNDNEVIINNNNDDDDTTTLLNVISVILILVYEAAHALGPSNVIIVLINELIPQDKRCSSTMYIMSIYWIFDYGFSTYLSIFTNYFSDQIFNKDFYECSLIFCLITIVLIYLLLIETKYKSLQQIQLLLINNNNNNKNHNYLLNLLFNNNNNNNNNNLLSSSMNSTSTYEHQNNHRYDHNNEEGYQYRTPRVGAGEETAIQCCNTTTIRNTGTGTRGSIIKDHPVQETVI